VASIALETSKIGLASTLVNSGADEDRSRLPRSGRYVRREPLNEGSRAQGAEAIDLKQPRISKEETHAHDPQPST
jgi:hypothetical protein